MESIMNAVHSLSYREGGTKLYVSFGKRVLDLFMVLLLSPVLLPTICVLGLLTRLDGGPAFFGHERIGKDGAPFRCWKIRSMVPDAELRLEEHLSQNPEAAQEWARDHKLTCDPRITRFGNFLRKTSLDELPQLLNVLRGEMSFVGPRPIISDELEKYGDNVSHYLAQRPGVTGLWQVSGRNDVSYEERVQLDVTYLEKRAFLFDIGIIAKTAFAVLGTTGR